MDKTETETAALLARVSGQHPLDLEESDGRTIVCLCGHEADDTQGHLRHVAAMQAAALAEKQAAARTEAATRTKAAEGTITISTEGLPGRETLRSHAVSMYEGSPVRVTLTRVIEAMPEPTLPLPTAPWSVVTDRVDDVWALWEDGLWHCGGGWRPRPPAELIADCGPITVRHDAGAGQ